MKGSKVFFQSFIMFALLMFNATYAQNEKPVITGNDIWFLQLTRYHINEKWMVSNELHLRRHDWLKEQEQFIVRPAINFTPTSGLTLTSGYSYVLTSPYGPFSSVDVSVPEHNIWQEVTLQNLFWDRLQFLHRFRLEERWIGVPEQNGEAWEIGDVTYANRFRYRLTARFDVYRMNEDRAIYVSVFDEIWLHLNKALRPQSVDRNWLYGGLGLRLNDQLQIEFAYLDQWVIRGDLIESYKGLQFSFFFDFWPVKRSGS